VCITGTIVIVSTLENKVNLGLIVLKRSFLSTALQLEVEGR
jgi:hypothetical protein